MFQITPKTHAWPVEGSFRIAHGSLSTIEVVMLSISAQLTNYLDQIVTITGRAECRPYARYAETPQSVMAQIKTISPKVEQALQQHHDTNPQIVSLPLSPDHPHVQNWLACIDKCTQTLPHGAAQNALNCALMDWLSHYFGIPVWGILGINEPQKRMTAFTLSIDTPNKMAQAALRAAGHPILKLKIKDMSGLDACLAVMQARPDAQIILDANEALHPDDIAALQMALADKPVLMIEQPVPADKSIRIAVDPMALPIICADESLHTIDNLPDLWAQGYRAVNVKLDKAGGIGPACALMRQARAQGFIVMAGCMVGSSLAMAPMMCLESLADTIDLDGPLLLADDIENGLHYPTPYIFPPTKALWGS